MPALMHTFWCLESFMIITGSFLTLSFFHLDIGAINPKRTLRIQKARRNYYL